MTVLRWCKLFDTQPTGTATTNHFTVRTRPRAYLLVTANRKVVGGVQCLGVRLPQLSTAVLQDSPQHGLRLLGSARQSRHHRRMQAHRKHTHPEQQFWATWKSIILLGIDVGRTTYSAARSAEQQEAPLRPWPPTYDCGWTVGGEGRGQGAVPGAGRGCGDARQGSAEGLGPGQRTYLPRCMRYSARLVR